MSEIDGKRLTHDANSKFIEPSCGLYIDACSGHFWHFALDGTFQILCQADQRIVRALLHQELLPQGLFTFDQAAPVVGLSRKTLYEWKRTGKLRREHGLPIVGRAPRLDREAFLKAIANGELSRGRRSLIKGVTPR